MIKKTFTILSHYRLPPRVKISALSQGSRSRVSSPARSYLCLRRERSTRLLYVRNKSNSITMNTRLRSISLIDFTFQVSWVAHDPRDRASILPALLQHVHFPLMSMDEVEQSSRSHLVKKNKNLATALEEARTYLAKVRNSLKQN